MAEKGLTPVSVHPVFLNQHLSAGESGTSNAVDLREAAQRGLFSLSVSVAIGTAGTAGTTVLTYSGCSKVDGTYVTPSSAIAIGTMGTNCSRNIITFEPELMPFIKIIATQTGTGTAGKDSKVTAELIVQ
jgi:hypothetical protein